MQLDSGRSYKVICSNIKKLMGDGYTRYQAITIALERVSRKQKDKKCRQ